MAHYNQAINEMVTCPYDPAHRMLKSRLQMHIVKCKVNHPDADVKTCPFNATHRMNPSMYANHLCICPDRLVLDKKLSTELDKHNDYKGNTSVPSYHQPTPECSEVWDVDDKPVAGYTPVTDPLVNGGLIQDLGLKKRAERNQIYSELHRVGGNESNAKTFQPQASPQPIREPKMKHQDVLRQGSKVQQQTASAGLGRGYAKIESRIAANIFEQSRTTPESPITRNAPMSYRQVLSGMNALHVGLGRGVPPQANENYNEDFPSLGLGRGQS